MKGSRHGCRDPFLLETPASGLLDEHLVNANTHPNGTHNDRCDKEPLDSEYQIGENEIQHHEENQTHDAISSNDLHFRGYQLMQHETAPLLDEVTEPDFIIA